MKYVVAFLAVAGLGLIGCGGGGADCDAAGTAYAKCYGDTAGSSWTTSCTAETDAGVCSRSAYWECPIENECSDTGDTDTAAKLSTCLTDNVGCE